MTAPLDEKGHDASTQALLNAFPMADKIAAMYAEVVIRAYLSAVALPDELEVVAWKMPDGKTTLGKAGWAFITKQENPEYYEPGQYEALQADIANAEELVRRSQAHSTIAALRAERDGVERERVRLWNEVRSLKSDLVVEKAATDTMRMQRDEFETGLVEFHVELSAAEARIKALEEALSFVRRWAVQKEGNGTSAEERLSAIAHHPGIQPPSGSKE